MDRHLFRKAFGLAGPTPRRPLGSVGGLRRGLPALVIVLGAGGCGPAAPPPRQKPPVSTERPGLELGQPVPKTIRASRMFSVRPSDEALVQMCRAAAAAVPLVYTCGACQREARAAARKRVAALRRWLRGLGRRGRKLKPAEVGRLHARHREVLGLSLSRAAFERLGGAPPAALIATFGAMVRNIGPYIIGKRSTVEEAARSTKVILRVKNLKRRGGRDVEVEAGEVRTLRQVEKELKRLAAEHGEKLAELLRADLVEIAASGLAPTMTLDEERTRTAQRKAVKRAKATRLCFEEGDEVVKKGAPYTLVHRQILRKMDGVRCLPCRGGLPRCAPGPLRRVRPGAYTALPITATRDFRVSAVPGLLDVLRKQAADAVPPVFSLKSSLTRARERTLEQLFQRAEVARKDRWARLRVDLERKLGAKVILQLLKSFEAAPLAKVRQAVLDLYSRAQAEPITEGAPPSSTKPCTLRRAGRRRATEETSSSCPIVPLPRWRLQLGELAASLSDRLARLPKPVQRAVVGLVQELLVANTTADAVETERRRKKAAKGVTGSDRTYHEGDKVVPGKSRLTPADLYVLEQMYSVKCAPLR